MNKFCITGISGTGKTTVSQLLNQKGYKSIDIDEVKGLCHWRNKETQEKARFYTGIGKDWLEAHEWICDIEKLKQLINQNNGPVVVIGMPTNQKEFYSLFDTIFLFQCSENTFIHRLNTRVNNDFGKDIEEQKIILNWYKDFEKEMLENGAIPINTEKPANEVAEEVIKNITN
ncbi:MAG: AAA family ATPase [Candidatus Pacebacteria bacterium]|nr:AAA family ATPase [Candidatus Paceibacterota bacterium]